MKNVFLQRLKLAALLSVAGVGCKGGEGTPPLIPATIQANSTTPATAVAGAAVSPSPSVIVRDQDGNPIAGQPVTFAVASGGGSVTNGSASTDANGIATVGQWTLGPTAGPNSLTATAADLSVTFNTTGIAGPTARLVISTGNNQSASPGAAVPTPPAVIVQDANGNPKQGITVTFAVTSGGGSVTSPTATSNASGIATVGSWILGSAQGANTLTASAAGAASVTFSATATIAKCAVRTTHALGGTSSGALETDDCQFSDGSFVDFFSVNIPSAGAYKFTQSAAFNTYLDLALNDGTFIAENGDSTSTNSAIKILLAAGGTYLLGAGSFRAGVTGAYSIASQTTSTDNANCELVFTVRNVTTNQTIGTDCQLNDPTATIFADAFYVLIRAGETITINMSSAQIDSYLLLVRRQNGATVAQNDNRDASTKDARITFTAAVTDYYAIVARTGVAAQTGPYTLSIQ